MLDRDDFIAEISCQLESAGKELVRYGTIVADCQSETEKGFERRTTFIHFDLLCTVKKVNGDVVSVSWVELEFIKRVGVSL
jgi:hypothetical protein